MRPQKSYEGDKALAKYLIPISQIVTPSRLAGGLLEAPARKSRSFICSDTWRGPRDTMETNQSHKNRNHDVPTIRTVAIKTALR